MECNKVINKENCDLICDLKTKKPHNHKIIRLFVKIEGFEPSTACLEGRCSIQLSYISNLQ